jgi:hypothetical protein
VSGLYVPNLGQVLEDSEYIGIRSCMVSAARASMRYRNQAAMAVAASLLGSAKRSGVEVLICGSSAAGLMTEDADLDVIIVGPSASVSDLKPHREQMAGLRVSLHVQPSDHPDGMSLADYCRWAHGRVLAPGMPQGSANRFDSMLASLPIGLLSDLYQHDQCRTFALAGKSWHATDIKFGQGGWVDLQILGLALRWRRVRRDYKVNAEWLSTEVAVLRMQEVIWVLRAYASRILGMVLLNRQALSLKAVPWFFEPNALEQTLAAVRLAALTCSGLSPLFVPSLPADVV